MSASPHHHMTPAMLAYEQETRRAAMLRALAVQLRAISDTLDSLMAMQAHATSRALAAVTQPEAQGGRPCATRTTT